MAASQPLAIQCRDPGEFISSIIEHHRGGGGGGGGLPPSTDHEKTYLVFVGIEDENGVFEMMDERGYLPLSGKEEEMPWNESEDGDWDEQRLPGETGGYRAGSARAQIEESIKNIGADRGLRSQSANDQKSLMSKVTENSSPPALPEREEAVSPAHVPPAAPPSSSPLSSPPPEEEDEELPMTSESIMASKGHIQEQDGSRRTGIKAQREPDKNPPDKQELHKDRGARSEDKPGTTQEARAAIPQTPNTHGQVLLQIREPSSPISPQPYRISPLTTPGGRTQVPPRPYRSSQGVYRSSGITAPTTGSTAIATKSSQAAAQESQHPRPEDEDEEYATYPTPTLDILSAAEHIELLYLHDLKTLRTFLTLLQYSPPAASSPHQPLLAIWGLIGAHHSTGEFSGEGIASTLSLAVDAAAESGRFLVLGEGYVPLAAAAAEEEGMGEASWMEAEVPVLRGGAVGTGVGGTVVVRRVLGRWCRFVEELE